MPDRRDSNISGASIWVHGICSNTDTARANLLVQPSCKGKAQAEPAGLS